MQRKFSDRYGQHNYRGLLWLLLPIAISLPAGATELSRDQAPAAPTQPTENYVRPQASCPDDLAPLMTGLLRDLPSYANRVANRSLGITPDEDTVFGTVLLAGAVDLEPLDLSDRSFGNNPMTGDSEDNVHQVFLTTLERQYSDDQMQEFQHYHWLFLTHSDSGWRLALMYSSLGRYPASDRAPTPPQESSNGIVGQAVRLWLRDCRAGAVYPVDPDDSGDTGL